MREKHLLSACTKFQVHLKKNYLSKYNNSEGTVMLNTYLLRKNRLGRETVLSELCCRLRSLLKNMKQIIRDIHVNCVTHVTH